MGLFDNLFGRKQTQTSQQTTTQQSDVQSASAERQLGVSGSETGTVQAGKISQLDEASLATLQNLIGQLGGVASGQLQDTGAISSTLSERAQSAEQAVQANIEQIVAGARQQGERELGQTSQQIARAGGSNLNTLVQQLQNQGRTELETSIGALEGQLGLQGREAVTRELATAGETERADLNDILQNLSSISGVTKGAETETTQESQQTQQQVSELAKLVEQLSKGNTFTAGTTQAQGSTSGNLLDVISLISAFT